MGDVPAPGEISLIAHIRAEEFRGRTIVAVVVVGLVGTRKVSKGL